MAATSAPRWPEPHSSHHPESPPERWAVAPPKPRPTNPTISTLQPLDVKTTSCLIPSKLFRLTSPTRQPRRSMVGINLDPWSCSLCGGIAANQGGRESIPEPDGCNQMPAWILLKEPPAPPSAEDSARSAIFPLCRGADPGKQPKESIIEQNPPRVTLITGVAEIRGS